MSPVLDDLPRDPIRMLQVLQQMVEVGTKQNAVIAACGSIPKPFTSSSSSR